MRIAFIALLLAACFPPVAPPTADSGSVLPSDDGGRDAGIEVDAGMPIDAGIEVDAGMPIDAGTDIDAGVPLLGAAFGCKMAGPAGGIPAGNNLQRFDFDPARFPDALCNDGSPAAFYFRPAAVPESRGRWLIQLQGGGGCRGPDDCAQRWCSIATNFGAQQMSSTLSPSPGMRATGILAARPDNPLRDWNLVYIHYCSSDAWVGTQRDVVLRGHHPVTGVETTYRAHFLGARILQSTLQVLRSGVTPMPDLDDATEVVLAGASAGGSGAIMQLDRIAAALNAVRPVTVRGLIDSAFGLEFASLDFSLTDACTLRGACTYEAFMLDATPPWSVLPEESCRAWHADGGVACGDPSHVIRHHLTTPFFVRMGQRDELHTRNAVEAKVAIPPAMSIVTAAEFAATTQASLLALSTLPSAAHEGTAVPVPGVYGPTCSKHETLESTPDTYDVFIDNGGGPEHFFDVWSRWVDGGTPSSVVATSSTVSELCP